MKSIVIIGANSYIARNMLVVLKTKYPHGKLKLYDYADKQIDGDERYTKVNVLDVQDVQKIDMKCDAIFMFVGKTGSLEGFDNVKDFIDINELALLNILNEYRNQNSYAKIIFPSTRLVYKGGKGRLSEESEKEFKTIYAINKFACEQYLQQYYRVFGVKYCILRICIPYGTLIPNVYSYGTVEFMLRKAQNGENITLYGGGSVRRTLIFIEDLCNLFIKIVDIEECKNDVYNIGGEDYSLKEMAEMIGHSYGVSVKKVKYPEIAEKIESGDTVFNDTKLQKLIHYEYAGRFNGWIKGLQS